MQTNPLILCEPNNFDHGYAITAACTEAWESSSETPLAFAQKRDQDPFQVEIDTVGGETPTPSLQRPSIHRPHQGTADGEHCRSMAMQNLHENMQLNTSVLWRLWDFMAFVLRPIFSSSSETTQVAALSTMELCQRLDRAGMGRTILGRATSQQLTMDEVPTTSNIVEKEILTESKQKRCRPAQRCKGKRQSHDSRAREDRTPSLACQCNGPALAAIHELHCCDNAATSAAELRGQTAEDDNGSTEETQRHTATRATEYGQRGCNQRGSTGNQTTPCSSCGPWTSTQGTTAGTTSKVPPAQCLAWVPQSSSHSVARLQCPIHGAGKANERESQCSHGSLRSSKGKRGKSQIHCGDRNKGRCNGSQRRGTRQRSGRFNSRSHQRGAHQPADQLGSPTILSRANGGGRAESAQKTSPRFRPRGSCKAIRIAWYCCGVWLGRVNKEMVSIALWPLSHAADVPSFIPKWTHTVLQEPSFVSEWQAKDVAFHLAWEVGILPPQSSPVVADCPISDITKPAQPHPVLRREGINVMRSNSCPNDCSHSKKAVTFSEVLCIRIGEDTSNAFHDFETHANALQSNWKPWKLHTLTTADRAGSYEYQDAHKSSMLHQLHSKHPSPNLVQVNSVPLRASVQTEVLYDVSQEVGQSFDSNPLQPEASFDVSLQVPQVANEICHNSQLRGCCTKPPKSEAGARAHTEDVIQNPVESKLSSVALSPTGDDCTGRFAKSTHSQLTSFSDFAVAAQHSPFLSVLEQIWTSLQAFVPQPIFQNNAVKLSHMQTVDHVSTTNQWSFTRSFHVNTFKADVDSSRIFSYDRCLPPSIHARREHESPIAHLAGQPSDDEDIEDEAMDTHDQPILPAFVNYLTNRLERLGLDPHDNDFDLAIRTWYIDHRPSNSPPMDCSKNPTVGRTAKGMGGSDPISLDRPTQQ